MRVAVVGAGSMGRSHLRVWSEIDGIEVVGVADVSEHACAEVYAATGIPVFQSAADMMEGVRPDAVSIVTPASTHEEVVEAAVSGGAHVLVEKPLGPDHPTARRIAARIREAGLVGMVGHIERYNPPYVELKRRLAAGEIGQIFQLSVRRLGPFPPRIFDVGVARDLAVHEFDKTRYLLGDEFDLLFAQTSRRVHAACEDMVNIVGRSSAGILLLFEVIWLSPFKVRETMVLGEGGMFIADSIRQNLVLHDNTWYGNTWEDGMRQVVAKLQGVSHRGVRTIPVPPAEPLRLEIEDFVRAIGTSAPARVTLDDGVEALRLADAAIESASRSVAVSLTTARPPLMRRTA